VGANPVQAFSAPIIENEPAGRGSVVLRVRLPHAVATQARAGQFVHIRTAGNADQWDPLLRRPMSLLGVDPATDEGLILVQNVGRGSAWLLERKPGESLDLLAPLGSAFTVAGNQRHLLMVAGGVGIAPLVMLAEEELPKGAEIVLLIGTQTAEKHLPLHYLPEQIEVIRATDDGTLGHHGFVTDLMPEYLDWADAVFACGPNPMFRSLRVKVEQHRGVRTPPVQVCIEQQMGCGMGVCLGCVVETKHGFARTCTEGPVFRMEALTWS
jgi:dihydroorotate dehydrogenase electron transfer subunit